MGFSWPGWLTPRRWAAPGPSPDAAAPAPAPTVSAAILRACGWVRPDAYAAPLDAACREHKITGPKRLPAFLAQVGHESGGGRWTQEIWGPTPAQRGYEGRRDLGNTQPGDGSRFRGRGLIQITGRANTTAARDALRPGMDLDAFCAWLETPAGAAESAAWWWASHGCNALADDDTAEGFKALTRRINGGLNGLADRQSRWDVARRALSG